MSGIKNQMGSVFQNKLVTALVVLSTMFGIVSTSVITSGLLSANQRVQGSGIITSINVGVYFDAQTTNLLSVINWGMIDPGESVTRTVYIKNEGNAPLTLSLVTENWNPSRSNTYIDLSWDDTGNALQANEVTTVTLSLLVSESIQDITSFNFDIVITGIQVL